MIITGIPFDEKLNIGVLSKVFERKRISNCYKYFWFQAILENIVEDKVVFTYDEILNQMIEDAWYMVCLLYTSYRQWFSVFIFLFL